MISHKTTHIPQLRQNIRDIYKESVELTFVYLIEGCGKT